MIKISFFIGDHLHLISVVKTTVLLADINDFVAVNKVYSKCKYDPIVVSALLFQMTFFLVQHTNDDFFFQVFSESVPARAAYQVAALPKVSSRLLIQIF